MTTSFGTPKAKYMVCSTFERTKEQSIELLSEIPNLDFSQLGAIEDKTL